MRSIIAVTITLCLLPAALSSYAATAYTGSKPFNSAISGYAFRKVFDFDSQTAGTSADTFGMVEASAEGLESDGETYAKIRLVATDDYSTWSRPNSVGASGSENQFLAGNSDRIVFSFSRSVHAFGLYLIGNPSPTGEPAIPFWKMHAFNASGFDAYSATTPLINYSRGNDAYFLGIVSSGDPFERVDLYSDNDLAAVYSFNVDSITIAADVNTGTLADIKNMASGDVVVSNVIVTRVHSDRFNVEASNRTTGMAIMGEGTSRDKAVTLFGTIQSNGDDERVLNLVELVSETDSVAPAPLGMSGKSVGGGSTLGLQAGCIGSVGPNNIGLDVAVWGKVTAFDTSPAHAWATIDDGSGRDSGMGSLGVKIEGPAIWGNGLTIGQMVRAQGSSSLFKVGSQHYPVVRVAGWNDISTLYWPMAY